MCDSDDSELSTKLIIDETNKRNASSSRRKISAQKKSQAKYLKDDAMSQGQTNVKEKSSHVDTAYARAHKRKSDSPQKRVHTSPEAGSFHIDMPMSLTSPPRNSNPTPRNLPGQVQNGDQHTNVSGISGSQRRKLVSPIKKYIDMPLLTFTEPGDQNINEVQNETSGVPAGHEVENVPVSRIENVIHIYPQNHFTDIGLQGSQVPQPIFIVNTSPTKYMENAVPEGTLSTLKAAAISSGILSDDEDLETTARELGINVQL